MELRSDTFADGAAIPAKCALAKPHPEDRVTFSDNVNPHLEWSDVPEGTKSFAIVVHDYDVPSVGDDVNQPDREVPEDLARVDFFHWVLIDLPADKRSIEEGEFCSGVTEGGKDVRRGPHGTRQGLNDFTGWFEGDPVMGGDYYGYDGPAPPWNDSIPHHYRFTVYALDVENLEVGDDPFTGKDVWEAIEGHVLAQASIAGTYTQNPRLAS
jgi:Raf kinase inhibitor-like YbhB/YbcL family protein